MSADPRNPKVGDEFIMNNGAVATITAVGEELVLARSSLYSGENAFSFIAVSMWQPVPIRPMIAEQWGRLNARGVLLYEESEDDARLFVRPNEIIVRLCHLTPEELVQFGDLFAVVCDENENPIEVPS